MYEAREECLVCTSGYRREDYAEANKKALMLLEKGLRHGFHLPKNNLSENLALLLNGIAPEKVELNFRTCISKTDELARLVVAYLTCKASISLIVTAPRI